MATAECPGVIQTDPDGYPYCEDTGGAPLAWVSQEPFSTDQIVAETASGFFAAGFVMVGTAWAIGRSCKAILDMIKR